MNIAFTICSKNYLAQAISLCNSVKENDPSLTFIIGLVDLISDSEREDLNQYHILTTDELGFEEFKEMYYRYNIVELSTAVKPFYIKYFFKKYNASKVIFLDPDIIVYSSLDIIFKNLENYSFILTPHIVSPIYDNKKLNEQTFLFSGIFNLGFFAIKADKIGNDLLDWLTLRLTNECIMDQTNGYFVDQKWMNLAICFFENYLIDKNIGLNVAHWNLHERYISVNEENKYIVNNSERLIFFHFSSYKPELSEKIATWQNRFDFNTRPDLKIIFEKYHKELLRNNYIYYSKMAPQIGLPFNSTTSFRVRLKAFLNRQINKI
ncbi:MAG: glycosyltransferase [Sphingobacteriia bacterium]|jgi:hypothetical protein